LPEIEPGLESEAPINAGEVETGAIGGVVSDARL